MPPANQNDPQAQDQAELLRVPEQGTPKMPPDGAGPNWTDIVVLLIILGAGLAVITIGKQSVPNTVTLITALTGAYVVVRNRGGNDR